MFGKKAFLQKLTSQMRFQTIQLSSLSFEGSSPPSVFVGHSGYPNVHAGPMLTAEPESGIYDAPELWLKRFGQDEVIGFRLNLVRGKRKLGVKDVGNKFAQQLQELALSKRSPSAEAEFEKLPKGVQFSEEHQPFGPSGLLKSFEIGNVKLNKHLEKAYYDFDLTANAAIIELSSKGIPFSTIQKGLSVGAFGKARRLVPTRWSITAVDDALAKHNLKYVRKAEIAHGYRVFESSCFNNRFCILLTPGPWQYEAVEAFINVLGNRTYIFSDYELYFGRKAYSEMGGCYYAQRNVIAEFLKSKGEQAGAFVFREIYPGYVPTGVWLCREAVKSALSAEPKSFSSAREALKYIGSRLCLGIETYFSRLKLLKEGYSKNFKFVSLLNYIPT